MPFSFDLLKTGINPDYRHHPRSLFYCLRDRAHALKGRVTNNLLCFVNPIKISFVYHTTEQWPVLHGHENKFVCLLTLQPSGHLNISTSFSLSTIHLHL